MINRIFTLAALCLLTALGARAFNTDTVTVAADPYLETPMKVTVIVPDGVGPVDGAFPTVYLLNGYGGDYGSWGIVRPDLGDLADQFGVVMVMPDGRDTWYFDSTVNPKVQMESFITKTLVPYIDSRYPTVKAPEYRAITGLSMGGHGAYWLGLRHPDIWKNIGSTSGGVNFLPFPNRWKIAQALGEYKDNPEVWESHTIINLVPSIKPGEQNLIFDCGSEDFFAEVNHNFHQALLDAKIPHDYISRPGVHNRDYWNNALPYQLMYFSTKFGK